jgi:peptide/nickel transport system permease protein
MARFAIRRLIRMVAVLFAVSVIVFLIFNVIPSNPAKQLAGKRATPQLIENVEEDWGFDDSLPQQYLAMMTKLLSGQLTTYDPEFDVDEQILEGLPATLALSIGGAILWLATGVLLGYVSALRAGSWLDRLLGGISVLSISIPVFLLAPVLLYLFAEQLGWFPNGGYIPLSEDPWQWFTHLVLPWVTIATVLAGFYARVLRSSMLDAMDEDYVRTARAKGLSERRVMTRHVLRNSLIPMITIFGLDFGQIIGGAAIIVEVIYGIDGVGSFLAQALDNYELPAIMGVAVYGAFFIVLVNALVDIAYAYIDPRVRLGETTR